MPYFDSSAVFDSGLWRIIEKSVTPAARNTQRMLANQSGAHQALFGST